MMTRKYQLVNNIGGWFVFAIALATYWLTLEPTASYWDCGEFIIQADKLEVGHPPGNPIFMLTARFFANFASDAVSISVMVNAMSGLLSALTILLLFWTITHLVRRLVVRDNQQKEISIQQYIAIMGSGIVGSLAYCWSDTFWFSAVEGEVYAFSSFCTALVFWLILKWEDHADQPHSDRYLVLIAYIIGVSIAVHLLNLLCIPAIVLVFAYRKLNNMNLLKSLVTLLIGFVIIALVLFGLVPGFIKVAQQFELLFVNGFRLGYNSGAVCYALVAGGIFIWTLSELYRQRSGFMIRLSVLLSLAVSGIFFFGDTFIIGWFILAFVAFLLFSKYGKNLSVRILTVAMWSIAVIFVGYSSYALILIRASAHTPMNQNAPDNVFDLSAYLNREQYGESPLIYGETLYSSPQRKLLGAYRDTLGYQPDGSPAVLVTPYYEPVIKPGKAIYAKGVPNAAPASEYGFLTDEDIKNNNSHISRGGNYYVKSDYKPESQMNPELNMFFPRIYSRMHRDYYNQWVRLDTAPGQLQPLYAIDGEGNKVPEYNTQTQPDYDNFGMLRYPQKVAFKPSFGQNLEYFFNYQLTHMYLRYFMWNFAGRQNDINNQQGELDAGNWISGIPFIDNARLGDQSLLPWDLAGGNAGHNVYFMLPLILGIIGLLWQSFAGKRGIEQFWVVFFLFFMTGIAIVLYLNQPPNQPRERDYAFAGSFYAFTIWIGMGVVALWRFFMFISGAIRLNVTKTVEAPQGGFPTDTPEGARLQEELNEDEEIAPKEFKGEPLQLESIVNEPKNLSRISIYSAALACLIGVLVPIQMVGQTWDDHDRSGRYAARDFAINYLESLEPNAIVFCNGDNDTFPLWYAQEVEGVRPDVRIINLSYLNSDWYANQMLRQAYDSAPVKFTAKPENYAYGKTDVTILGQEKAPADLLSSLKIVYEEGRNNRYGYPTMPSAVVTIPIDKEAVVKAGLVAPKDTSEIVDKIMINLGNTQAYNSKGYLSLGEILMLDIIATNAAEGWPRPIYWASTVGDDYHLGLTPYLRSTGMAQQLVPTMQEGMAARTDRAYDVVTKKYRWGGADFTEGKAPYFDETARRMLLTTRSSMLDVVSELIYEGDVAKNPVEKKECYDKALEVANLLDTKLDERTSPYGISIASTLGQAYCELGEEKRLNDKALSEKGLNILYKLMEQYAPYLSYNRAMAMSFGNPTLTYETRLIPYQFYRFIYLYEEYGGNPEKVEALLKPYGVTPGELENNYNTLYNPSAVNTQAEKATPEELRAYAAEIADYCRIANEMSKLSPEEYAKAPEKDRAIDSMIYQAIEFFRLSGGSLDSLEKYPSYRELNMERAMRLNDEFYENMTQTPL